MTDLKKLQAEFQVLQADVNKQEKTMEHMSETKLKLETQINLMKLILVEQMQKFHQNVKDNLEDENIDLHKIAPMGPDFDIWES